jgi:hypothetical protein
MRSCLRDTRSHTMKFKLLDLGLTLAIAIALLGSSFAFGRVTGNDIYGDASGESAIYFPWQRWGAIALYSLVAYILFRTSYSLKFLLTVIVGAYATFSIFGEEFGIAFCTLGWAYVLVDQGREKKKSESGLPKADSGPLEVPAVKNLDSSIKPVVRPEGISDMPLKQRCPPSYKGDTQIHVGLTCTQAKGWTYNGIGLECDGKVIPLTSLTVSDSSIAGFIVQDSKHPDVAWINALEIALDYHELSRLVRQVNRTF